MTTEIKNGFLYGYIISILCFLGCAYVKLLIPTIVFGIIALLCLFCALFIKVPFGK